MALGLLLLGWMGLLHMALSMARQNAASALSAYNQHILDQMLEMLASNAALCHDLTIVTPMIEYCNMACKRLLTMGCIGL